MRIFPPEVMVLRRKEQASRSTAAQHRALSALARAHPEEYGQMYRHEKRKVYSERGPLPGDEE